MKTKVRVREAIWWPGINDLNQVEQLVFSCETCTRFQCKEPLLSPQRPWEKAAADLFELEGDHTYYYSGLLFAVPGNTLPVLTRSANVISAMTEIFACHGIPSEIVSDNGPQFSGAEFQQFTVKHISSSPR